LGITLPSQEVIVVEIGSGLVLAEYENVEDIASAIIVVSVDSGPKADLLDVTIVIVFMHPSER